MVSLESLLPVANPVTLQKLIQALCQPVHSALDQSLQNTIERLEQLLDEVDAAADRLRAAEQALDDQIQGAESGLKRLRGANNTEAGLLLGLWQSASGQAQGSLTGRDSAADLMQRISQRAQQAKTPLQALQSDLRQFRHIAGASRKLARERASGSQASASAMKAVSQQMIRLRTRALLDQAQARGWMKTVPEGSALERAIMQAVLQRLA
ncbi:MAG: hypothetical protein EBT36_01160 [Betaproteobacteria bacterium]|jgi:predicted ribosome quality control (RQC) complex YloA/Tae2 family protein|nr:hypothetical protein [Betaproteobacteria bacterium]NDG05293.1 hypothetical protein [Alphaproteobacteria bacterium]NBO96447.1 hypothetical protein [Betaproteobacteria bacterium]NBP35347.1 hypothetical protein [Betaproteobacteria bacterium]NBP38919.1 hypothetical protein [Betaproteobacteria bacterium]